MGNNLRKCLVRSFNSVYLGASKVNWTDIADTCQVLSMTNDILGPDVPWSQDLVGFVLKVVEEEARFLAIWFQ